MNSFFEKPIFIRIICYVAIVLLAAYLGHIFIGKNGMDELRSMRQQLNTLKQENARLEKKNIELYRTVNRLKTDPVYIDYIIRRELQMTGKDEEVFKFEHEKKNSSGAKQQ